MEESAGYKTVKNYLKLTIITIIACCAVSLIISGEYLPAVKVSAMRLNSDATDGVLIAPYEAVREDENFLEYVYVLSGNTAQRRYITTGEEYDNGFETVRGLDSGEIIIIEPDELTRDIEFVIPR